MQDVKIKRWVDLNERNVITDVVDSTAIVADSEDNTERTLKRDENK